MANTKSAKKAARQAVRRTAVNKARRSRVRTAVRKVEEAIAAGDRTRRRRGHGRSRTCDHSCGAKKHHAPQRRTPESLAARASHRQDREVNRDDRSRVRLFIGSGVEHCRSRQDVNCHQTVVVLSSQSAMTAMLGVAQIVRAIWRELPRSSFICSLFARGWLPHKNDQKNSFAMKGLLRTFQTGL